MAIVVISGQAEPSAGDGGKKILLESREIIPTKQTPVPKVMSERTPQSVGSEHILIQLDHIPDDDEKEDLRKAGVELLVYIPENSWLAKVPKSKASNLASMPGVTYTGPLLPEDKISEHIRLYGIGDWSKNDDGTVNIRVQFFQDVDDDAAREVVGSYGEIVDSYDKMYTIKTTKDSVWDIAGEDSVQWIDQISPKRYTFNNDSRKIIGVETIQSSPYNLSGSGFVAAQWDVNWTDFTHDDLAGRVEIGDAGDDDSGAISEHSTNVAGTMIGNGSRSLVEGSSSALQWRGMAPEALMVTYEWWDIFNSSELSSEYKDAISNHGAVVSQNSWGALIRANQSCSQDCVFLGEYDLDTAAIDNITRGSLGMPITTVWAAGNERSTGCISPSNCNCGHCGHTYGTVVLYGTSKNSITVGAVDKSKAMTFFSSWGPTKDGRIKPDVVAVGYGVTSTSMGNDYETGIAGTSIAAPAVSGAVLLLYEDYNNIHGQNPLPSTVKALLMHTAEDREDTGPDFKTGYGLVNATEAIDKIREDNSSEVVYEGSINNTGGDDELRIYVPQGQQQLKITLVWSDYPGVPLAAKELVNDLDLIVKNSTGDRFYPWTLDPDNPSFAAVRNASDHVNVVEQVLVTDPDSGLWTVTVNGSSVSESPQSFSLVSDNGLEDVFPQITINKPLNGTVNNDTFNVTFGNIVNWSAYELDSNGTNITIVDFPSFETVLSGLDDGPHNITVYANDSSGNNNSAIRFWTRDTEVPDIFNLTNGTIQATTAVVQWNTTETSNSTVLFGTNESELINSTGNSSLSDFHNITLQSLTKNTTYHYNVSSCDDAGNCNTTGPHNFTTPECNENWSCSAWSACSGGTQTRICEDQNLCGSIDNKPALSQSCVVEEDKTPTGSSGTVNIKPPPDVTVDFQTDTAESIDSIPELQDAVEDIFGSVDDVTIESMKIMSSAIGGQLTSERSINYTRTSTSIETSIEYNGSVKVRNFMVFEQIPKIFATSAGSVTVTAPGGSVQIVEEDPSWLILFPEIGPGDEVEITYTVAGRKSSSSVNLVRTEVYAESFSLPRIPLEEPENETICGSEERKCDGDSLFRCSVDGSAWDLVEECTSGCDAVETVCKEDAEEGFTINSITGAFIDQAQTAVTLLILAVILVGYYYLRIFRRK